MAPTAVGVCLGVTGVEDAGVIMPLNIRFDLHAELTDAIGKEGADKFCAAFGGRLIYIPASPRAEGRIAKVMGLETASKIAKTVGAGRVLVPLSRYSTTRMRKHLVMIHLRNGSSNAEIAQALKCHTRTVTRLTSQLRREGRLT